MASCNISHNNFHICLCSRSTGPCNIWNISAFLISFNVGYKSHYKSHYKSSSCEALLRVTMAQRNSDQIAHARLGRCSPNHLDKFAQAFGQLASLPCRTCRQNVKRNKTSQQRFYISSNYLLQCSTYVVDNCGKQNLSRGWKIYQTKFIARLKNCIHSWAFINELQKRV